MSRIIVALFAAVAAQAPVVSQTREQSAADVAAKFARAFAFQNASALTALAAPTVTLARIPQPGTFSMDALTQVLPPLPVEISDVEVEVLSSGKDPDGLCQPDGTQEPVVLNVISVFVSGYRTLFLGESLTACVEPLQGKLRVTHFGAGGLEG